MIIDISFNINPNIVESGNSSIKDFVLSLAGILVGIFITELLYRLREKKSISQAGKALLGELVIINKIVPLQVQEFMNYVNGLRQRQFEDSRRSGFQILKNMQRIYLDRVLIKKYFHWKIREKQAANEFMIGIYAALEIIEQCINEKEKTVQESSHYALELRSNFDNAKNELDMKMIECVKKATNSANSFINSILDISSKLETEGKIDLLQLDQIFLDPLKKTCIENYSEENSMIILDAVLKCQTIISQINSHTQQTANNVELYANQLLSQNELIKQFIEKYPK